MAYGGIAGLDGRKKYGIGSWFQEKIMDPVKKVIPNELKNPAVLATLGGLGLNQWGLPDWLPGVGDDVGQNWIGDLLGNIPGTGGRWELQDLVKLRLSAEQYGLKLTALENVPTHFYDEIMLGGDGRDRQIENMIYTVRNIAKAGIPIFGYNWMPSMVWRTTPKSIRCGAFATAFDYEEAKAMPFTHGREYFEDEMWQNLEYWINIITPIAEEEGIRLGIHPCDPPVEKLGGIPQLLRSYDSY